jgi:hypothetical protein
MMAPALNNTLNRRLGGPTAILLLAVVLYAT